MANWSEMKRFFNAVLNVFVTIFQRNFQGKDIDSEKNPSFSTCNYLGHKFEANLQF